MDFEPTERQVYWRDRVRDFIESHVRPAVPTYREQDAQGDRWKVIPVVEELKAKAKEQGIWNLFMPPRNRRPPPCRRQLRIRRSRPDQSRIRAVRRRNGRVGFASEVFNCSAPDTGNMEVFHRYGTREQKEQWLQPADERRDPLCLPDDRAAVAPLRCDQHRNRDRPRWRRICHQRPQMVVLRPRRSALQGRDRDGQDRLRAAAPCPAVA